VDLTTATATTPELARRHPVRRRMRQATRLALVRGVGRPSAARRVLPTFLIIGAQRCGTTTLWRALLEHPAVVPPRLRMKGVHHLDLTYPAGEAHYRAHFPTRAGCARRAARVDGPIAIGEASPYYLFHPAVPERIATMIPDVRLVVLLRDPIDRAYSHYHHMVLEGHESAPSFELALALEEERLHGAHDRLLRDPAAVSVHHLHHSYLARGRYAEQIERYRAHVDDDQLLILPTRALRDDPEGTLRRVTDHLGIAPLSASVPMRPVNAGRYAPMAPATRQALRRTFRRSDERLFDLVGARWW
jgi:hypothetical protein